ncbi:hypothetical protein ES703_26642 [subsurface metagenome]
MGRNLVVVGEYGNDDRAHGPVSHSILTSLGPAGHFPHSILIKVLVADAPSSENV